jgi:hypothetical protein
MEGTKIYLQPMGTVLNTINDIVELQNGKLTFSDTPNGRIHFLVRMYASRWEYQFAVTDIGQNRCQVQIEIDEAFNEKEREILREFALLDSMLLIGAKLEISEKGDNMEG